MKRRGLISICFLMIVLYLSGCDNRKLSANDYIKWVESPANGLVINNTISGLSFDAMYVPSFYTAAKENRNPFDKDKILRRAGGLDSFYVFKIRIGSPKRKCDFLHYDLKNENEYYQRLQYCITNAREDILLIAGEDTLHSVNYHFESANTTSYYNYMLVAFSSKEHKKTQDLVLIYNDKIAMAGQLNFYFPQTVLTNIPLLNLNENE